MSLSSQPPTGPQTQSPGGRKEPVWSSPHLTLASVWNAFASQALAAGAAHRNLCPPLATAFWHGWCPSWAAWLLVVLSSSKILPSVEGSGTFFLNLFLDFFFFKVRQPKKIKQNKIKQKDLQ